MAGRDRRLASAGDPRHDGAVAQLTIHAQTAAVTSNEELFRNNAGPRFRAVLELAHQPGRSPDMDRVLERLLDQVLVLFAGADRVQVLMREGENPVVRAIRHRAGRSGTGPMMSRSALKKVFGHSDRYSLPSGGDPGKMMRLLPNPGDPVGSGLSSALGHGAGTSRKNRWPPVGTGTVASFSERCSTGCQDVSVPRFGADISIRPG